MSNLIIVLTGFSLIILISVLIVFIILKVIVLNRQRKMEKYTGLVEGIIIKKIVKRGIDQPSMVTVEYEVDQCKYQISEAVKLKGQAIKLGPVPIGRKKTPVMGDIQVGSKAKVRYNTENPSQAILQDNKGIMTV